MSSSSDHLLSDEERGETPHPRRRALAFTAIVAVAVAAVVGIALASDRASTTARTASPGQPSASVQIAAPATGDIAQAELVDAEDTRLHRAVSRGTSTSAGVTTVVLDRRDTGGAYDVDDLIALGAASRSGRIITVRKPIVIRTGAALTIDRPGSTLRLAGTAAGPVSIVAWGGSLTLSGSADKPLTVIGWDRATKGPDTDVTDGRGYVRAHSGRLTVSHTVLDQLGFWSGRTGGLAVTGTSFKPGKATISDSSIRSAHIGLYLSTTTKVSVKRTGLTDSDQDGIELDRSRGTRLSQVTVAGSGVNGVHAHDQSSDLSISAGSVTGSGSHGILVDGRPQADGPNALGYGVVNTSGLTIATTAMGDNAAGGVQVSGTSGVDLGGLTIDEGRRPVRIVGRSTGTVVHDNDLTTGRGPVVEVIEGATGVELTGNTLSGRASGISIGDAKVDVTGNTISIVKGSALRVTSGSVSGSVDGNTVKGSGPHAFAVPDGTTRLLVQANDLGQWKTTHPWIEWIERTPFAPLWLAILIVPAIGLNFIVRRHRAHRDLRRLTEETIIAMARTRRAGQPVSAEPVTVPAAPATPPRPAPTAPRTPAPADVTRTDRLVVRGAMGQFRSTEDLAIHAVLEGGKSPEQVARMLQVPVSVVITWVTNSLA